MSDAAAPEFWTIYSTGTGVALRTGHGPAGIGAMQALAAGESLALVAAVPGRQKVQIVSGAPQAVANPGYVDPAAILAPQMLQSADGTRWKIGATNGGAVTLTSV